MLVICSDFKQNPQHKSESVWDELASKTVVRKMDERFGRYRCRGQTNHEGNI